jgi:conjugal transfer pilus assembly protein TraF
MKQLICFIISISLIYCQILEAGWLNRKAEGWFWYEDRAQKLQKEEKKEPTVILPPAPLPTATEQIATVRKELEEKLAEAILNPTDENLAAYMKMQQIWVDQSAQFSRAWLKTLLNNPQLDSRVKDFPVTQYGVQVQKQIVKEKREQMILGLVNQFGLFFFYEGKNKASQAFSFVVKEFAKKYGWQVVAISCDNTLIPEFENNQLNNGIVQKLEIETFPSLFLVEPKQQIIVPIAFGLSSLDQIEANIEIQLNEGTK